MDGRRSTPHARRWQVGTLVLGVVAAAWAWPTAVGSRGIRLALLAHLRVIYPFAVVGLLFVLALATCRVVSRRVSRRGKVRWLAFGLSTALAVMMAEGAAALDLAWTHRSPALPKAVARTGDGDRDVRIVVVGESSAEGVPYRDWLSVGKVVAWQLRKAIPWRMFHVEVQARPGWTLEQMHQKLVESRTRADVVILYAGHNEFASRFGWSTEVPYYQDERPPFAEALARRVARVSPLERLISELLEKERVASPPEPRPRRLVDVPSQTPAERAERLADFRRRLGQMVAYCERVGAFPVLVIPPGNDAGFEPNRSVLPPETPATERDGFAREVETARALEATAPEESLERYRSLIARYPGFAETHFRLARLLESRGEAEEAARHYAAARDADGHPIRCPTDFQDAFRETARGHDVLLVDGQAVFRARGQLDDALFNDAMHPSFEGQIALARAILAGLKGRDAFGWPAEIPAPTIGLAESAEHFDVREATWAAVSEFAASFYRTVAPIRFDPAERRAKQARYEAALGRLTREHSAEGLGVRGVGMIRR